MIAGTVTSDLEPILHLELLGAAGQKLPCRAVIDTGYNGYLTLPKNVILSLGFTWLGFEKGTLADGKVELFEVYSGKLIWHGQPRTIEVDASDSMPLLGMRLLHGHELRLEVVENGKVSVAPMS